MRSKGFASIVAVVSLVATAMVGPITPVHAATAQLFVAPGGSGDCSAAAPCGTLQAAVSRASGGQIIEVAAGSYPSETINGSNAWSTNVIVQPAPGATVTMAGLGVNAPHLTFRGLRASSAMFHPGGRFGRFEGMTVTGPTMVSASDIAIVNGRLGPSPGNDSVKIASGGSGQGVPTNVLIEGNEIGPAVLTAAGQHVDAIQTHGAANLTIRRNIIREAASQNIMLGQEIGPNSNILIENNVIEQCWPQRTECGAYYATSGAGANIRFLRNTIKGAAYPENESAYIGNIIGYAQCTSAKQMSYNLIQTMAYGSDTCDPSNRTGVPSYGADGYHLTAGSAGIDIGGPAQPSTDIDGRPRVGLPDAGAAEYSGGTTSTAAPATTTTTRAPASTTTTTAPPHITTTTAPPSSAPATSSQSPQGDWVGNYGANGYVLAAWNKTTDLVQPGVASVTMEQGGRWQWAASSTQARALESANQAERRLAGYYDANQVRVRLNFAQAYSGTLHLYAVDGDSTSRRQNMSVNDGTIRTLSMNGAFDQGLWGHFPLKVAAGGSVMVTVDRIAGPNAVLSGLFLGGPTATTPTTTPTTAPPSRTPAFPLFPTAETTGVRPGTTLVNFAGPVTTDGAVIENVRITGQVRVAANNVTFRNCELASTQTWAIAVDAGFNGLTLEDCTHSSGGIIPPVERLTLRRSKVTPTYARDGITVGYNTIGGIGRDVLIEDSYIRALYANPGDHLDGIQFFSFGRVTNITIRHNYIEARDTSGNGVLANAALFISDGTNENVIVEQNYLDATGYFPLRLYSTTPTSGHIVRSNRWGRAGSPPADLYRMTPAIWEDNRYQDTGQLIPQPAQRTSF